MTRHISLALLVLCLALGLVGVAESARAAGRLQRGGRAVAIRGGFDPADGAAAAAVGVDPRYQGRFVHSGETAAFTVTVRNNGGSDDDTFAVTASSAWPVSLYRPNGVTPLDDTDGDGTPDTGRLSPGMAIDLQARVETPASLMAGAYNIATLTVCPHDSPAACEQADLRTAVPASFAQAFRDAPDQAMRLYLSTPDGQAEKAVTSPWTYGDDPTLAVTPAGTFLYAWDQGRCLDGACSHQGHEIIYAFVDRYGRSIGSPARLVDHGRSTVDIHDEQPSLAVTSEGQIGIVWRRHLEDPSRGIGNDNVWFAVLDPSGALSFGPVNLTNNAAWGAEVGGGAPHFAAAHIAAVDSDRFAIIWQRQQEGAGSTPRSDVYYEVRGTDGWVVKDVTAITDGASGARYVDPFVTQIGTWRALVACVRSAGGNDQIYVAALDHAGAVVQPLTRVTDGSDGEAGARAPAAALLGDGRIAIAWVVDGVPLARVRYAVLKSDAYSLVGLGTLDNPAAADDACCVSVVPEAASGRAVLSWADSPGARQGLYYALLNSYGQTIVPPMLYRQSLLRGTLVTNDHGGSAATYATNAMWLPEIDGAVFATARSGAGTGHPGALAVRLANYGALPAAGATLTATLGAGLAYAGDTFGVPPTVSGSTATWRLPELPFLADQAYTLWLATPPGAPLGARYDVALSLTMAGVDANLLDNIAQTQVTVGLPTYLPLTRLRK